MLIKCSSLVKLVIMLVMYLFLAGYFFGTFYRPTVKPLQLVEDYEEEESGQLVPGRCGQMFDNTPNECGLSKCCSARGWCSNSPEDCLCPECIYYEWEQVAPDIPANGVLEDDDSEFDLGGYKNYVIQPQINCGAQILIVVYSAMQNFAYRQVIRETWGREDHLQEINATLFFATGRYPNLKLQERVLQEAKKHKDILQGDFFEDYFLLAYKSLTWMTWSRDSCGKVPWIVKTDDDMVNNVWKLGAFINRLDPNLEAITCSTKTERVIRFRDGTRQDKWVIPYDEWPKEFFPRNCWGVIAIYPDTVRNKLIEAFETGNRTIFRVDDVYITGMLAERANITHRDISELITMYENWDEEDMLTGNVWFGHIPPDDESLHRNRYWLWQRIEEHEQTKRKLLIEQQLIDQLNRDTEV